MSDGGRMGRRSWLDRYRSGERDQVWHELRQLGSRVREPGHVEDARLVCDEMARRARHNVELVVERLIFAGTRFHDNDPEQRSVVPFVPATDAAAAHLDWLERTVGPVPLTLGSWLRLVGDVWLVGTHPDVEGMPAADPLVVELEGSRYPGASMRAFVHGELDAWREQAAEDAELGLFVLPVAPDRLTKSDVSGGAPYGFVLPDGCADGLFVAETTTGFVSYLNRVFSRGGLPFTPGAGERWWRLRNDLAKDLLPL